MNTKKDFIATARIIAREVEHATNDEVKNALCRIACEFGNMYAAENPLFKADVFFKACGMPRIGGEGASA